MNYQEQEVLRELHTRLTSELDAKIIIGRFYELKYVTRQELTSIKEIPYPSERAERLIFILLDKDECDLTTFLRVLSEGGYQFLADEIQLRVETVSKAGELVGEEERIAGESKGENREVQCPIPKNMDRVSVYNKRWRNKTSQLAHELTRLVHDGKTEKFKECRKVLVRQWKKHRLDPNLSVEKRFELADRALAAVDTEIAMKRIKYDHNLINDPVFSLMQKLIPYTSDPIVASMSFLARRSSALIIGKPVDEGLENIKFAKGHSESVSPCRESGMVFYIEFNMLAQKYEDDGPTESLKSQLIKTAKASIGHFSEENRDEIRTDFRRMLLLKIANVHLGIGAFGNIIQGAPVGGNDERSAKKILDELEEPEMWNRMEKRRKMFFHIAKSRLFSLRKQHDLALHHGMLAKTVSLEGGFSKELPHIEELLIAKPDESSEDDMAVLEGLMANVLEEDDIGVEDS